LVYFDEIFHGVDDIEGDLGSIILTPVSSTIPKWLTFKYLWGVQLLTDFWIWMKFCMEVMTLRIASTLSTN
jgi:hypothetical protein